MVWKEESDKENMEAHRQDERVMVSNKLVLKETNVYSITIKLKPNLKEEFTEYGPKLPWLFDRPFAITNN